MAPTVHLKGDDEVNSRLVLFEETNLVRLKTFILQGVDGSVYCLQGSELLSLQVWIRSCQKLKEQGTNIIKAVKY